MNTAMIRGGLAQGALAALVLAAGIISSAEMAIVAKTPPAVPNSECMDCHEAEFKSRKRGEPKEWVGIRPDAFAASAHARLNCVDCHNTITEPEHTPRLPKVDCASCHGRAVTEFSGSIHGLPRNGSKPPAATCASCHGKNTHELLPAKHIDSPVSKFNLLNTCAKCHQDGKAATELGLRQSNAINDFRDSIHGHGLYKMGLKVAPTCNDCHGVHDIKSGKDLTSHTHKSQLSATCTACHVGIEKTFAASVHGAALLKGDSKAPVCTDCHSAHQIERPTNAHFKLTSDQSCGKCHDKQLANYHQTYHGKAMVLNRPGSAPAVAACYDCHGHHEVFGGDDARSKLHRSNIVKTCAECHPGANLSFTQYQAHADPYDAEGYPLLNKVFLFMTTLLLSVFAFFGLHTLLWVTRMVINYLRDPVAFRAAKEAAHADGVTYRRFTPFERFLHMLVATSFLMLVITGMPLKFYDAAWAKVLFNLLGGPESARTLHHLAAIVTFGYFALHLGSLALSAWRNRGAVFNPQNGRFEMRHVWGVLFGPDSMVPSLQDLRDMIAHVKWFFGKGEKPQWDRWTYWERFDYLAVFWGVAMIGVSGLVLWFPVFFTKFIPGWGINIAHVIHSDEALLAAGFIFTFHFFNTHFRLDRFPMDMVIFSGRISKNEMMNERKKWFVRLVATGRLEQHRVAHDDWESRRTLYKALGFVMVGTGLFLLGLIIYAFLSLLVH